MPYLHWGRRKAESSVQDILHQFNDLFNRVYLLRQNSRTEMFVKNILKNYKAVKHTKFPDSTPFGLV